MIPLVSTEAEIKIMKDLVINIASEVQKLQKVKIEFMVGTMIELPRAAIKAKEIAKHAEFFSFGTNDLTQTTFGISRDDSGKFLNDYIDNKIFTIDPFVSIDEGVMDLVEIAVDKGKKHISSTVGHELMNDHSFSSDRLVQVDQNLKRFSVSIQEDASLVNFGKIMHT